MNERLKGGVITVGVLATGAAIWWAAAGTLYEPEHTEYRATVTGVLLDPQSAQFRNEKIAGGFYCGEVNSKNRMGGYAGFNRFIVRTEDGAGILEPATVIGEGVYSSELLIARLGYHEGQPDGFDTLGDPDVEEAANRLAFDGVWRRVCQ